MGLGFDKPASEASSRGLGFVNWLGRLVARVWVSVTSCIDYSGKVYKICQKRHPAAVDRVAEWTRAGAGEVVAVGLNLALSMNFFSPSQKISEFFGGLVTGTPSTKFPVPVPVL